MELRDMYGGLDMRRATKFKGRTLVYRMSNVAPWQLGQVDELVNSPHRLDIYQMYVLPK